MQPLEVWPRSTVVRNTFVRKLGFCLSLSICSDILFRYGINIFLELPSAVIVIESLPLAKVLHITIDGFAVSDDTFSVAEGFKVLFLAFLFEVEGFAVFLGDTGRTDAGLPDLVSFDIIVNTFEAPEALEELISLVCVMKVRKVFPFDMKALDRYILRVFPVEWRDKRVLTMFSNQRSSASSSLPSSRLWPRTASISSSS